MNWLSDVFNNACGLFRRNSLEKGENHEQIDKQLKETTIQNFLNALDANENVEGYISQISECLSEYVDIEMFYNIPVDQIKLILHKFEETFEGDIHLPLLNILKEMIPELEKKEPNDAVSIIQSIAYKGFTLYDYGQILASFNENYHFKYIGNEILCLYFGNQENFYYEMESRDNRFQEFLNDRNENWITKEQHDEESAKMNHKINELTDIITKETPHFDKVSNMTPKVTTFNHSNDIFLTVKEGKIQNIKFLIENNKDPHYKLADKVNSEGTSLIAYAAAFGSLNAMEYLYVKSENKFPVKESTGENPLHYAAFFGHTKIVQFFIDHINEIQFDINATDINGETALHKAAYSNHPDIIRLLLKNGANVEARTNKTNETALHVASRQNSALAAKELLTKIENYPNKPIAKINAESQNNYTPLHKACANGHYQIVELLLINGANPNMQTCQGNTSLHISVKNGNEKVTTKLINIIRKYGGDIDITNNENKKPIDLTDNENIKSLLRYDSTI